MKNITELTVKTALKKMFSQNHFSICTIKDLCSLTNTIPETETLKHMQSLHCVNYSDMPEELRQWLFDSTLIMFSGNGFDLDMLDFVKQPKQRPIQIPVVPEPIEYKPDKKNFIQKLLG